MPIALLLQKFVKALQKGGRELSPWIAMIATEELLLGRARSAFLVHWFGGGLPLYGFYLRVAIENLPALRERYREVSGRTLPSRGGLNLTEPLAGLAGTAIGILLSPTGAILGSYAVIRFLWRAGGGVLAILGALVAGPLITAIGTGAAVVLLPVGFIFGLAAGGTGEPVILAGCQLLAALAGLLVAVTRFLDQLMGPREAVRNPLLRLFLDLLDRVAPLFAHVLGFVAVLVTRVGPLIYPLAKQAVLFIRLAQAVFAAITAGFHDLEDRAARLGRALVPHLTVLSGLGRDPAALLGGRLLEHLITLFARWSKIASVWRGEATTQLLLLAGHVVGVIKRTIIEGHWFMQAILAAIRQVQIVLSVVRTAPAPSPGPSRGAAGGGWPSLPFVPTFPGLPALPEAAEIERRAGLRPPPPTPAKIGSLMELVPPELVDEPFRLSEEARRAVERARRFPPSVFEGERALMRQELGQSPTEALEALRTREMRFREHLFLVVDRIMPATVRVYMPELRSMFRTIDEHLYRAPTPEEEEREFPVRQLPEHRRLRPVVRELTISSQGGDDDTLRTFKEQLLYALRHQDYLVPARP